MSNIEGLNRCAQSKNKFIRLSGTNELYWLWERGGAPRSLFFGGGAPPPRGVFLVFLVGGAASSRDHLISRLEAAPTVSF
jgi:hypothetical protein